MKKVSRQIFVFAIFLLSLILFATFIENCFVLTISFLKATLVLTRFVKFFPPNFVFSHIFFFYFYFDQNRLFGGKLFWEKTCQTRAQREHTNSPKQNFGGKFFFKRKTCQNERRKLLTAFSFFDRNRLWVQLLMKEEAYQAVTFQCSCCLLKMWE
jgi:hypothetical protein